MRSAISVGYYLVERKVPPTEMWEMKMAEKMDIPIVGLVENMSYVTCPDCGRKIYLFGEGKSEQAALRHSLPLLAQMPIDPALASLADEGRIEDFEGVWLSPVADALEKTEKRAD